MMTMNQQQQQQLLQHQQQQPQQWTNRGGGGTGRSRRSIYHRTRGSKAMSTSESSLFSAVSSVSPSVCSLSTHGSSEVTSVASSILNSPRGRGDDSHPRRHAHQHHAIPAAIIETTAISVEPKLQLPPARLTQTYELSHSIGSNKGAFSTVWLGSNRHTGETVAVKMIRRDELTSNEDKAVFNEVAILNKLQQLDKHQNKHDFDMGEGFIQLVDFFATSHTFYIVTEYMDGGDMMDLLEKCGRFLEEEVHCMIHSLVKSMHFMHQNGVAHRDLKPENLLIGTRRATCSHSSSADPKKKSRRNVFSHQLQVLKVADFGLASTVERPRSLLDRCGTPMYVAPEVLRGQPYDQTCDMWSLGVIVYYLLSGCPPFYDKQSKQALYKKILRGTVVLDGDGWDAISPEAKHFISSCLSVNPRGRMTSLEALRHPWLHGMESMCE